MKARRLAFLFATLPLAFYAYACSSDDSGTASPTPDGGDTVQGKDASTGDPPTDNKDATTPGDEDGSVLPGDGDSGVDAGEVDAGDTDASDTDAGGDAGPVDQSCVGNPLSANGATPDGGVKVAFGALRKLTVQPPQDPHPPFYTGSTWIDANGGKLVISQVLGAVAGSGSGAILVGPDGGAGAYLRQAPNNSYALGNAADDKFVYTAVSSHELDGTSAIYRTAPDGGVGPTTALAKTQNPTGIALGPGGNVYFADPQYQHTTSGETGVFRLAPNGAVTPIEKFGVNTVHRYNYVAISPDLKTLYVSDTELSDVRKLAVAANGTVTAPSTSFATTAAWPVGLAVDNGGNVWVVETGAANAAGGRVEVFAADGTKIGEIALPNDEFPTAVAFGAADGKTAYISTQTNIYVYNTRCAGVR